MTPPVWTRTRAVGPFLLRGFMSTQITAAAVNELRKRTDLPLMECKSALVEAEGDIEKAIFILRTRNTKVGEKRAMNETAEGRVAVFVDESERMAAIVEMRCESAPVAKSEHFVALGNELAKFVATHSPISVAEMMVMSFDGKQTVNERVLEVIGLLRENMKIQRFARFTGDAFGSYVHHNGSIGVLVQFTSRPESATVIPDVCMHAAAANPTPVSTRREDVPAEVLTKEMELATAKALATGKPAALAAKIAEGQMKAWYGENVLLEQPFVKDPSMTVGSLVRAAGTDVVTFVRYKVGEVVG